MTWMKAVVNKRFPSHLEKFHAFLFLNQLKNRFFADNEDVKSHLPEHEAAAGLLSLSRRTPSCENSIPSPNLLVPCQPMVYPYERNEFKDNANRSIQIATPLNSDGKVNSAQVCTDNTERESISLLQPMDLTKPRVEPVVESKMSRNEIISMSTYAGAAGLLNSLMTLSDKVPSLAQQASNEFPVESNETNANFSNDVLMQTYLTERALQRSKMKLSQRVKSAIAVKNSSQDVPTIIYNSPTDEKPNKENKNEPPEQLSGAMKPEILQNELVENEQQSKVLVVSEPLALFPQKSQEVSAVQKLTPPKNDETADKTPLNIDICLAKPTTITNAECLDGHSGMDTLAEIAASSVKLDTTKPIPCVTPPQQTMQNIFEKKSPEKPVQKEQTVKEISAKNIATEFLKIASVEKEMDSASLNADDSSGSSDVDIMENSSKKSRWPVSLTTNQSSTANANMLISARTVVVGEDGKIAVEKPKSSNSNALPVIPVQRSGTSNAQRSNVPFIEEDGGPSRCSLCSTTFPKKHQLVLHMNIHYMYPERKFRCTSCGVNFYTQGRLQKHLRSETHNSKVNMVETLGHSTSKNPRPFECSDCNRAFRIHGHLAKHLRSKTHVQKLECLQKLPFGTYAESK